MNELDGYRRYRRSAASVFQNPAMREVPVEVTEFASVLPRLPDGRLDYSASPAAAVLDCYVYRGQELLVLKRNNPLEGTAHTWHIVSGFLDELLPLGMQGMREVCEEIGPQEILTMYALPPYCSRDVRMWTVYPMTAEIQACGLIRLNEEHSDYAWIPFDAAPGYLLPHVCAVWSEHRRSQH